MEKRKPSNTAGGNVTWCSHYENSIEVHLKKKKKLKIKLPWKSKCYSLSHVWLFAAPLTAAHQAPLSMEFSRQEYWSGVPFFSWDLRNPGIEPTSPPSNALKVNSWPTEGPGKPWNTTRHVFVFCFFFIILRICLFYNPGIALYNSGIFILMNKHRK